MKRFDIYMSGVGGQGIGLLSEAVIRAADHAGLPVCGVDTHGLAQRGGMVESFVRIGGEVTTPLVRKGSASLVLALERTEAFRAAEAYAAPGGVLLYFDTLWQPLDVRLGKTGAVTAGDVEDACRRLNVRHLAEKRDLSDVRMQNVALLSRAAKEGLIPGVEMEHYRKALEDLEDLLPERLVAANLKVLQGG